MILNKSRLARKLMAAGVLSGMPFTSSVAATFTVSGYMVSSAFDGAGFFGPGDKSLAYARYTVTFIYNPTVFTSETGTCGATCVEWTSTKADALVEKITIKGHSYTIRPAEGNVSSIYLTANDNGDGPFVALIAYGPLPDETTLDVLFSPPDANSTLVNIEKPLGGSEIVTSIEDNTAGDIDLLATADCGDGRDQLVAAYPADGVYYATLENGAYSKPDTRWQPQCTDFSSTAQGPDYTFATYTHGLNSWALVQQEIVSSYPETGVDSWVHYIGSVHVMTSGYRDPAHNLAVNGAKGSRHLFGSAVDLQNISQSKKEWDMLTAAATNAGAAWVEPFSVNSLKFPCRNLCVHADWNYFGGAFMP